MKLKQVLFGIVVCYLCVNTLYVLLPFTITSDYSFYGSVMFSMMDYRSMKMTFIHLAFDLILIITGIRSCMKQNGGTNFTAFALIMTAVNFDLNLIWAIPDYVVNYVVGIQ